MTPSSTVRAAARSLAALALALALAGCGASAAVVVTDVAAGLAAAQASIAAVQTLYGIAKGIAQQVEIAHPSMTPTIDAAETQIEKLLGDASVAAADGRAIDAMLDEARALIGGLETAVAPFVKVIANGR